MVKRFLTVSETAALLRVHPESIRRAVREGKIPGARRVPGGRLIRIPESYITGNIRDRKSKGPLPPPTSWITSISGSKSSQVEIVDDVAH